MGHSLCSERPHILLTKLKGSFCSYIQTQSESSSDDAVRHLSLNPCTNHMDWAVGLEPTAVKEQKQEQRIIH